MKGPAATTRRYIYQAAQSLWAKSNNFPLRPPMPAPPPGDAARAEGELSRLPLANLVRKYTHRCSQNPSHSCFQVPPNQQTRLTIEYHVCSSPDKPRRFFRCFLNTCSASYVTSMTPQFYVCAGFWWEWIIFVLYQHVGWPPLWPPRPGPNFRWPRRGCRLWEPLFQGLSVLTVTVESPALRSCTRNWNGVFHVGPDYHGTFHTRKNLW